MTQKKEMKTQDIEIPQLLGCRMYCLTTLCQRYSAFLTVMKYLSICDSMRRLCDVTGCIKGRNKVNKYVPYRKPTLFVNLDQVFETLKWWQLR